MFICVRPKASDVLQHPLFWSSEMWLSFLRDSSNRIHLEKGGDLLSALEGASKAIFSTKFWTRFSLTTLASAVAYIGTRPTGVGVFKICCGLYATN